METSWLNPFSPGQGELVTLSTATEAPPEMAKNLLEAYQIRKESYQTFKQERLKEEVPSTQFHERITKKKLKTFSDIRKKSHSKCHSKEVVLKADRKLARWSSLLRAESCI